LGSVAARYQFPLAIGRRGFRNAAAGSFMRQPPNSRLAASRPTLAADARTPEIARLEAVLLIAREPLSVRRLAQIARLADGTQARTLVRRLARLYDEQQSAFRVEEFAGGFQLLTRAKFSGWLRRIYPRNHENRLSAPALETLAVVAYRQPIVRAEIEAVRGVGCGEILRQLMDRDLIRIVGRANELGRPFLYGTTKRFLQAFGLRNLDGLPRAAELRAASVKSILPLAEGAATADATTGSA
jgi:segregation and condensation protein B